MQPINLTVRLESELTNIHNLLTTKGYITKDPIVLTLPQNNPRIEFYKKMKVLAENAWVQMSKNNKVPKNLLNDISEKAILDCLTNSTPYAKRFSLLFRVVALPEGRFDNL